MEIPFLIYDKNILIEKDDGISKKYNEVLKIALSKYDMEKRVNRIIEKIDNYKFLIIKYLKKFIISIEAIIMTFPKKDIISRNMIYNDLLEVLELIIMANYEVNKDVKHNYQIKAIAKINKIDFYLERAYKLKYISEKQVINKSNELLKINKMLYKWCSNG